MLYIFFCLAELPKKRAIKYFFGTFLHVKFTVKSIDKIAFKKLMFCDKNRGFAAVKNEWMQRYFCHNLICKNNRNLSIISKLT